MKSLLRKLGFGALVGLLCAQASLLAQTPPAIFVKMSTSQVASGTTPTSATTTTIAAPSAGWSFSAAAPIAGTTWNQILRPNPLIGSNNTSIVGQYVCNSANNIALSDASGAATDVKLTLSLDIQDLENNTTRTEPNTASGGATALGPAALMQQAWRIYRGNNGTIHRLTGLPVGAHYYLYVYGTTTTAGQGCKFILDAANVPGGDGVTTRFVEIRGGNSGNIYVMDGANFALTTPAVANVVSTSADNNSWGRIHAVVDATGALRFRTAKNAGNGQYYQGYQLMPYPVPSITLQPAASASATVGGELTLTVAATGEGVITYQWRKNGAALADGPSGSGSAYAGTATASLAITGVSAADAGDYDVVVTNYGGSVPSATSTVSITTDAIAPAIVAQPAPAGAVTGGSASLTVSANGTAPLSYQWQKSSDNASFANIDGATSAALNLASITVADAGYYRAIVTNSVGSVTSASAALTVAPVIVTAPSAAIVAAGSGHSIAVVADAGAGAPQPTTYVWRRGGVVVTDGSGVSGAGTASLAFAAFSAAHSGYYTVTVSNSAGSVATSAVYVGLASAQGATRFPAAGAVGVNPDAPLVLTFPEAPRVGSAGKITVRRSSDDSVVETIDLGALQTISSSVATYRYQSRNVGGSGGGTYNYTPVSIVGNEARISLKSAAVLAYSTSYYVTIDAGAVLDSTGASLAPVAAGAWTFTTKVAAPDPVPTKTSFVVAADGSGDFSTLQGALDFIPAGNTTPVRIDIKAGVYHEIINTGSRHNLSLVGEGHAATVIQYGNCDVLNGGSAGRTSFYAKGNDLLFRNLSLVNTTPKGGSQAEALRSDGQRVVLIDCAFRSFQDTLLLGGTSYFQDCLIAGDTDYIWGGGTALFKNCELLCLNPADLTQARTPADRFGFVFLNCALTKPAGSGISYGLGRNSDNSNVAFIDCRMDTHISAAGWSNAFGSVNLRNWEYNSRNLAGTAAINVSQRVYGRQLTATEADVLRIPANVYGLTTDGTPAGAQGGGWVPVFEPSPLPVIAAAPQSRSLAAGQSVTFTVGASGSAAFTYQWRRNGSPIAGAVAASYTIAAVAYADAGSFDCVVTNSSGSTTSAAATLTVLSPVAVWADGFGLDGSAAGFASADADGDGLANLLEYVLGGNPIASDAAGRAPIVTVVEDAGGKHLVLEYVRAVAASAVPVSVETSPDLATWTARSDGVDAEIEIIPFIGQGINVDVNTSAGGNYTGLAAAPGDGVTWNSFLTTTPTLTDVRDSQGNVTATDVVVASSGFSAWSQGSNGSPNPLALMQDYLFNYTYTVTLNSLPAGAYRLYVYAHGDQDGQVSTVTVAAANGGGTKGTAANGGAFRDAFAAGAEGVAYVKFSPVVGAGGTLQFTVGPFLNGFQLVQLTDPDHERVRVTIPFTGARLFARLRAVE